jgi:hypothetical protein
VPEYHEPLSPRVADHQNTGILKPHHLRSVEVKLTGESVPNTSRVRITVDKCPSH